MKKASLITVILLLIGSVATAAPLSDYSAGKGSVDLTWNVHQKLENNFSDLGAFLPDSAKNKFAGGLTIGLGHNLAFQYKNRQGESNLLAGNTGPLGTRDWSFTGFSPGIVTVSNISVSVFSKVQADEFNLLYKLNPNLSVFAGTVRVKGTVAWDGSIDYRTGGGFTFTQPVAGSDSNSVNGYQVGFVAATQLTDKLTGWATVGLGNKIESWEFGMGYPLAENLDLNLSYSKVKYKDLNAGLLGFDLDSLTASGIGMGVTYKF